MYVLKEQKMNVRENLINDIKKFELEANANMKLGEIWFVKEIDFSNLKKRIFALTENEFDNQDKFNLFFKVLEKEDTKTRLKVIEYSFKKNENHLGMLGILALGDFFEDIKNALK